MKAIEGIPDLRLARTESIRFHEHPEPGRTERLVRRLRQEARLRNPPIVTALGGGAFVLLDGANRVSAFRELGWSHIPVQVIDYGRAEVQLKGWHHLLVQGKSLDLQAGYEKIPGVRTELVTHDELSALLELRRVYAALVDDAETAWGLFPESGIVELTPWMQILEKVVAGYEGRSPLERIKLADYENLPDVFQHVQHQLVLFPTITKVELLDFVRNGVYIPTGITRHLIPGRALGLNIPLGFVWEMKDEEAKRAHFRGFVEELEMAGRIRYYEESVFMMSE